MHKHKLISRYTHLDNFVSGNFFFWILLPSVFFFRVFFSEYPGDPPPLDLVLNPSDCILATDQCGLVNARATSSWILSLDFANGIRLGFNGPIELKKKMSLYRGRVQIHNNHWVLCCAIAVLFRLIDPTDRPVAHFYMHT